MRIIDDTYNGEKFPIVEREYNAYYFPDNYDPDNLEAQSSEIAEAEETHQQVKVYQRANPE